MKILVIIILDINSEDCMVAQENARIIADDAHYDEVLGLSTDDCKKICEQDAGCHIAVYVPGSLESSCRKFGMDVSTAPQIHEAGTTTYRKVCNSPPGMIWSCNPSS